MTPLPYSSAQSSALRAHDPMCGDRVDDAISTLLARLEASLDASQKAILASDLVVLEESTREQARLSRMLGTVLSEAEEMGRPDSLLREALHPAAMRVVHSCRVQASLPERGQRRVRAISNLVAGTEATYCPCVDGAASLHAGSARCRNKGGDPCQA